MQISELLEELGRNKQLQHESYDAYKKLRGDEERLKSDLIILMRESGAKSFKGQHYLASISEKTDIAVTHEQSVLDWLKTSPNVEQDVYIGLKLNAFKGLAKQVLKDTGEIIPGTDLVTKETLTIKGVK